MRILEYLDLPIPLEDGELLRRVGGVNLAPQPLSPPHRHGRPQTTCRSTT
eukprot:CAMPEP_0195589528 /NCGR_PEP_ID=MMETSP0814-20130614/33683_1 /TAXON_ID=97485 /ORGANISM="Prymnesium parvum, Strain Texoma1" /LENGTH=49 /DNA_ID= /DNA_START= /DNA_END= /DNA_ORIENTATION=